MAPAGQADTPLVCAWARGGPGWAGPLFFPCLFWCGWGVACCRVPGLRALVWFWLLVWLAGLAGWVGGCGLVGCELYSGREHLFVLFVVVFVVVVVLLGCSGCGLLACLAWFLFVLFFWAFGGCLGTRGR